jgi:hypothetical protein
MTRTTDPATTGGVADTVVVEEQYWEYRFDASAASARTDTPDLMRVFEEALTEELLKEGYREMADADAELAEADMAAGFETLARSE